MGCGYHTNLAPHLWCDSTPVQNGWLPHQVTEGDCTLITEAKLCDTINVGNYQ